MDDTRTVHTAPVKRVPRGVRMDENLWDFVDDMAPVLGEKSGSHVIERWVREKRDAVLKEAA